MDAVDMLKYSDSRLSIAARAVFERRALNLVVCANVSVWSIPSRRLILLPQYELNTF